MLLARTYFPTLPFPFPFPIFRLLAPPSFAALRIFHFPLNFRELSLIIRFVIDCRNDVKDLRFNWFYLSAKCRPPDWTRDGKEKGTGANERDGWELMEMNFGSDARQLHWFTWQLRGWGPEKMHKRLLKILGMGDSLSSSLPLPLPLATNPFAWFIKQGSEETRAQETGPISLSWTLLKANHKRLHTEVKVVSLHQPPALFTPHTWKVGPKSWQQPFGRATELLPGWRNFRLHWSK